MGCDCGTFTPRESIFARSPGLGSYPLLTYPDCQALHRGAFQGLSVYIVGRGREEERLFRREQLIEADTYARSVNRSIENVPTAALCDQAVLDVYAPATPPA